MKYSIAILSAATLATAVRPVLLNSVYNVVEGEPFTLTFQGCEDGCTITVEHGEDEESMKPVEVLTGKFAPRHDASSAPRWSIFEPVD